MRRVRAARLYRRCRGLLSRARRARRSAPTRRCWWRPEDDKFGERLRRAAPRAHRVRPRCSSCALRAALRDEEIAHVLDRRRSPIDGALDREAEALAARLLGRRPAQPRPHARGRVARSLRARSGPVRARAARAPQAGAGRAQVIAGRYKVEALLGAGAFADVYRARDCDVTDHVVALKILRRAPPMRARWTPRCASCS